ncbi:holin [Halalkalibacter oceani]|uniref:holin n=1 Tax=Halalkalibacter oceani TaxID=1653776 RepID=UPI0033928881
MSYKVSYPKNYAPAVAVLIGLIIGILAAPFTELDVTMRLWAGGFAGLAATGLFEIGNKQDNLRR